LTRDESYGSASQIYSVAGRRQAEAIGTPGADAWATRRRGNSRSEGEPRTTRYADLRVHALTTGRFRPQTGYWTNFDSSQTSSSSSSSTSSSSSATPAPRVPDRGQQVLDGAIAGRRTRARGARFGDGACARAPRRSTGRDGDGAARVRDGDRRSADLDRGLSRDARGPGRCNRRRVAGKLAGEFAGWSSRSHRWRSAVDIGLLPSQLNAHEIFSGSQRG